ncbi:hypothetical protein J6590_011215 [Homalodisca vitripennis]|nr:hypothetical protein J6590_011215 [Homalodisca vitripennis]
MSAIVSLAGIGERRGLLHKRRDGQLRTARSRRPTDFERKRDTTRGPHDRRPTPTAQPPTWVRPFCTGATSGEQLHHVNIHACCHPYTCFT